MYLSMQQIMNGVKIIKTKIFFFLLNILKFFHSNVYTCTNKVIKKCSDVDSVFESLFLFFFLGSFVDSVTLLLLRGPVVVVGKGYVVVDSS